MVFMKCIFNTDNINKRAYRRLVSRYIIENFGFLGFRRTKDWTITFYPSTLIGNDPQFPGVKEGTAGVTGLGTIRVYVYDKSGFGLHFITNAVTITHEIAHAVLIASPGGNQRVRLRHDDLGGNKAGTLMNYSTAEVHDRLSEKRFFTFRNWLAWGIGWKHIGYNVLDFRDHHPLNGDILL